MIIQRVSDRIILVLSLLNKFGTFPLKLNKTQGYLYVDYFCYFRTLHLWMWFTCYATIVLPTHMQKLFQEGQIDQLSYTIIIWLGCVTGIVLLRILSFRPHGICQFLNAAAKYQETFSEKFMSDFELTKKEEKRLLLFEKSLFLFFCLCSSLGVLVGLDCFIHPQAPAYTLFEIDKRFISLPVYLFANLWFGFMAIAITTTLGYFVYVLGVYFGAMLPIIKNEMRTGKPSYKTSSLLRSDPFTLASTWRSLECIVILINTELTYDCLLYVQGCLTTCIVFAVVTLRFHGATTGLNINLLMIGFAVNCFFGYTAFLYLASLQYKWSSQTISSWKREHFFSKKHWLYVKKFQMSCKAFCIGDGRRYVIRPKTVLIFLRSTCRSTIRALLTYGSILSAS